jgi:hypothetical protein
MRDQLPPFHPMTMLRDWSAVSRGAAFRLIDALTHVICMGATGGGKSSGPLKHLALAYLVAGFSFVVLCSKPEERAMWEEWAEEAGRWNREKQTGDLVIFTLRPNGALISSIGRPDARAGRAAASRSISWRCSMK